MKARYVKTKTLTASEYRMIKKVATDEAIEYAFAIMFTALRDNFGFGRKRLQELWCKVEYLSDSISKGYIDIDDLLQTLDEEAGIELGDKEIRRNTDKR